MNRIKAITLLSGALFLGACGQNPAAPATPGGQPAQSSGGQTATSLGILPKSSPSGRWFIELQGEPGGLSAQSLSAQQQSVRLEAQRAGIQYQEVASFQTLFNGFSVEVADQEVGKFSRLRGVKAIYPVDIIEQPKLENASASPEMFSAVGMTGADIAQNELGLTGKGIKVGVIDTGIDNEHPAFAGRIVAQYDFVGDDYDASTAKGHPIPQPDPIADDCGGHGSHVAGIIGGNDPAKGFKGVAPEVSFGSYRVFGCNGSTTGDIMLQAMERAAQDGMNVVNMSIGSSFQWAEYPTAKAADRLVKRGVVVTVSAGNSGTDGQFATGAPSLGEKVISVAAVDNAQISLKSFTVSTDGQTRSVGYMAGSPSADPETGKALPVVVADPLLACNVNGGSPFVKNQFSGKAVLIQRGSCNFAEKAKNVAEAGASAVLMFNNAPGYISPSLGDAKINVPFASFLQEEGEAIKAAVAAGKPVTVSFNAGEQRFKNPTGGSISSFSSYGMGPDLDLKPEISAPGGNIYSAVPLDPSNTGYEPGGYGVKSGTSMAAPHVAGAAALLLQGHRDWTPEDIKTRMMNTASTRWFFKDSKPVEGTPVYTQLQGAGMVDIPAAYASTVVATPAKLSLGESEGMPTHSKVVLLTNHGDKAQTFTVQHVPALSITGSTYSPKPDAAGRASMSVNGQSVDLDAQGQGGLQVTVPAGGQVELNVKITAPTALAAKADYAQYGGYLVARGQSETVSVPYGGFQGDYQKLDAMGPVYFVSGGKATEHEFPALYDPARDMVYFGGDKPEQMPDYTFLTFDRTVGQRGLKVLDAPTLWVHFNHQAQKVIMEAVDASGAAHEVETFPFVGRDKSNIYQVGTDDRPWSDYVWDGTYADGSQAPAGQYQLRLRVLKALGDENNSAHWENYTSPAFKIVRGTPSID
ncbi:S8 family serine peptidase [Deinococcus sp. Marseille-Q6407]|uniref:S8 family serine peptidase n=1 Tax=Deinococcus sp. Marseille-Q6407 TaxID=2969223 RepID=UPI0021C04A99|nr:S8 family serine peptidase [Deinococcus sp. Marseille-Q6407]